MKDGRLHLRLSKKLLRRLKKMAKELDKPVSELATSQLETMVKQHEEYKSFVTDAEQV